MPSPTHAGTSAAHSNATPQPDGLRETIESVVVAFVLAFLFRTFEAEAFVIPTGSMAPTLMGRHKDLECENCGFPYRVSAKDEVDDEDGRRRAGIFMETSTCPNCRYTMDLRSRARQEEFPSYSGDRILVAKFPYDLSEPKRWDVVVFKYPVRAHQNFIKRLVGLPGETIRIVHGDIYFRAPGQQEFQIARKPPPKLLAMLQTVYDNDYAVPEMVERGWPPRWQPWSLPLDEAVQQGFSRTSPAPVAENGPWTASDDLKQFQFAPSGKEPAWIRYTHTVPSHHDWRRLEDGLSVHPENLLIEDYNAYNMGTSNYRRPDPLIPYWVGDLGVECEVALDEGQGQLVLELVEGGVQFQCTFDLATGEAKLSHSADDNFAPKAKTNVKGPGVYQVALANADDQLFLWVDGKLVDFDAPTTYGPLDNIKPQAMDHAPVGIAAQGVKMKLSHLRIVRDIYYIASKNQGGDNPDGEEFPLEKDQFFVLGDNSAQSLDARFWRTELGGQAVRYVDRELLTGKALLIYWPHSFDEIPGTGIYFPFYPNFARMGYVR